jgi:hypothetical protein
VRGERDGKKSAGERPDWFVGRTISAPREEKLLLLQPRAESKKLPPLALRSGPFLARQFSAKSFACEIFHKQRLHHFPGNHLVIVTAKLPRCSSPLF